MDRTDLGDGRPQFTRHEASPSNQGNSAFGDCGEFGDRHAQRLRRLGEGTRQELAATPRGNEPSVLYHDSAAAQHYHRPTAQPATFVRGVANIVVQYPGGDLGLALWVPDRDVCVAANRDRALLRIEPVKLGVVGGGQGDKGVEVEPPLPYPLGKR